MTLDFTYFPEKISSFYVSRSSTKKWKRFSAKKKKILDVSVLTYRWFYEQMASGVIS